MHRGCIIRSFIYIVLVCLFVYILSFSFSLRLFIVIGLQFQFPDFFFLFSLVHPVAIYLKSRKSLGGGGREFFSGGCENHVCYIPTLLPGTKRRNIQGEGRIRFPDLDLVLSHPPPPLRPLFFTHCRSSWTSKFSSIETIPHPPLYRVTRATYRVTKTYIVGKRLDFSQPPSSTTDREEEQASGKRDRVFYIHAHEYRVFHFRSSRGLCVEEGWRMISKG